MGCGCGKNKLNNNRVTAPRRGLVPTRTTPSPSNNVQARNNGRFVTPKLNNSGVMSHQKRVEQIRRNAILRNMKKPN
jgi:hypothetical protein